MELEEKILMQSINLKVLVDLFVEYIETDKTEALTNYKKYIDCFIINLTNKNTIESMLLLKELIIGTLQLYLNSTNSLEELIKEYKTEIPEKMNKKHLIELKQSIYTDKIIDKKEENFEINNLNINTSIFQKSDKITIENVVKLTEEFLIMLDDITQKLENKRESKQIFRKNLTNF